MKATGYLNRLGRLIGGRSESNRGEVAPTLNPNPILAERFTSVYHDNIWQDDESRSGPGSRKDSESVIRAKSSLNMALENHGVRSIGDIPCGDFNWMGEFLAQHDGLDYVGYDIVRPLIERNRASFPKYKFETLDITSEIPQQFDLIFSKDMLNHLLYADIQKSIDNMKRSKSKYLLVSNNTGFTNTELHENTGGHSRHIDLCAPPFSLPAPIWNDGYMALWRLSDV